MKDKIELDDMEVKKMQGEVGAFFLMGEAGQKAWKSFLAKQYKLLQEWNIKRKNEEDNLEYEYNWRYYRTRYGQYRRLYITAEKEDKIKNAKKYEIEEKKKQESELKKQ